MATESFEITRIIRTSPDRVYRAWLDSAEHSAMTNTKCTVDPRVGGTFEVGDGYARGANVALEPDRRIVQTWRASDFPEGAMESRIELLLERTYGGTRLTLRHTDLPEGSAERYRGGWDQFYFRPMDEYFDTQEGEEGRRHLEAAGGAEGEREPGVTVGDGTPLHATISEFAHAHGTTVHPERLPVSRPAAGRKPAKGGAKKPVRAAAKKPAAKKATAKKKPARRPTPKRPTTKRKLAGNKKTAKAAKAGKAKPVKKKGAAKRRR